MAEEEVTTTTVVGAAIITVVEAVDAAAIAVTGIEGGAAVPAIVQAALLPPHLRLLRPAARVHVEHVRVILNKQPKRPVERNESTIEGDVVDERTRISDARFE